MHNTSSSAAHPTPALSAADTTPALSSSAQVWLLACSYCILALSTAPTTPPPRKSASSGRIHAHLCAALARCGCAAAVVPLTTSQDVAAPQEGWHTCD